jgi:hypothetical protein
MTTEEHSGVWLADVPLDSNEGADGDTLLEVTFDDLAPLADYEWVEEGKPYREWLVPAALVNLIGKVRIWGRRDDWAAPKFAIEMPDINLPHDEFNRQLEAAIERAKKARGGQS